MLAPVRIEQQPDRPASPLFAGEDVRLAAVRGRDTAAHGQFYHSVPTTGVYCNPSCAARPALRQNMAFHETPRPNPCLAMTTRLRNAPS